MTSEPEPLVAAYDVAIAYLMEDRPEEAEDALSRFGADELWAFFDRATKEQIAREDLREMVLRRALRRTSSKKGD